MKIKHIIALSVLTVTTGFLLNSCGTETPNPKPTISLIAEGGSLIGDATMDGDKAFKLVFQVSDDSKVEKVVVSSVVNGRTSPQFDTTLNSASSKISLTRRSYAAIATEVWTISVTDDKGASETRSFTINTTSAASGDPLSAFDKDNNNLPFKVWNINGPNTGAFDLSDGTPRTKNDPIAEKDLLDSCIFAEIPNWPARLTSANGTLYKKVTGYVYDDITNTTQIDAAWDASGVAKKLIVVAKDELYIAKLRGGNAKVLVYITNVVKTTGDNLDYIQFKFKKKLI